MGPRQRLERRAALDQNAAPGGLGYAGDECNRRCQNERAWRCRHQNGQAANEIAGNEPRNRGHRHGDWKEHERVAVGQPHERRLRRLGCGDEAHDPGIGAFPRRR